ncbi:hypothetical protein [Nocardia sp. NPDC004711]
MAGDSGIRTRHVQWGTVAEGPVEGSVALGKLVLTMGAGYDRCWIVLP